MLDPAALALWLAADPAERVTAMADLIESGDLLVVPDDGENFGLVRAHNDQVTRFECPLPPLAACTG
jgi:hypothetical protein